MPMLGHLAENGLVLGEACRDGNEAPASRNLECTQAGAAQMPTGKRIAPVRADRAAYPAALFKWCEEHTVTVAMGGVQETAVQAAIAALPENQWPSYRDGHLAETVHRLATARATGSVCPRGSPPALHADCDEPRRGLRRDCPVVYPTGRDQRESHQSTEACGWDGPSAVWHLRGPCRVLSHRGVGLQPICVV